MSPQTAQIALDLAELYGAFGVVVAAAFAVRGLGRIDRAAASAYAFRILLLPGLAALWPYVLWRWTRATRDEEPHR